MTFYPCRVVTIRLNEMKILMKLELSYIMLQCKFQLFVTLICGVMTIGRSKMGERVTCRHVVSNNYNKFHDQVHLQLFQYFLQFFRHVDILKQ
jgi:hypothetical protein